MKNLKRLIIKLLFPALIPVVACGYSSKDNELVGQVKKVVARTPILCGDYYEVDLSLGVLRNGVGSMSREDVVLYVGDGSLVPFLKRAAESGDPVKVGYDIKRVTWCVPDHWLTSAQSPALPSVEVK
jgi:hypothetical protein